MSTVIIGHISNAGEVLGVHGGDGPMSWLRAATGSHLYGDWDGVEWVGFEPGGRAGLHTHSHTEEIWYILRGEAEIELDGVKHSVAPDSLVLTPLHSSHALWNSGAGRIEYVVIEVFPPAIRDALPLRRPTDEGPAAQVAHHQSERSAEPGERGAKGGHVTTLGAGQRLDATPFFRGSWSHFERVTVAAAAGFDLEAAEDEYAVYVVRGRGGYEVAGLHAEYTTGSVLTLGWRALVTFYAGEETDLFITGVTVQP